MKNHCMFFLVSLLIVLNVVHADEILWSYDLTELPYMWTKANCTFSSSGARINILSLGWPKYGRSADGWLLTEFVVGSSDFDSLVIHTSQYISLYAGSGTAYAVLELQINGVPVNLWERSSSGPTFIDSLPIHEVMTGISNGDLLRFRFYAYAFAGYNQIAEVDWRLWDVSLTAYGALSLEQSTWAGIKAVMGCQFL
ncbi:MAG: hypothetical protein KAR44_12625 [Candidatus Aegiribacteria sp.]|nr:hypothetical protein [Candidatus Aegiribacteria sp.]